MRPLTYYIGTSLDGLVAGPHDEVDFYPLADDHLRDMVETLPEVIPTHLREPLGVPSDAPNRRFDTVIQGRRTYQPALDAGITSPYAHLDQYVASTTLGPSSDPAVTVVDDPVAVVRDLKERDGQEIWLAGGGTLAHALADEIDLLVIKLYPVLAGAGLPLFRGDFRPRRFELVERGEPYSSGTMLLTYRRVPSED